MINTAAATLTQGYLYNNAMADSKVNVAATSKIVLYLAGLSKMIIESALIVRSVGNLTRNSQHVRNKKNRENTFPEKKKKKTITRTRQYLRGSTICLRTQSCRDFTIIREKYKMRLQFFSLSRTTTTTKQTLITKNGFLHLAHRIHNGLQNGPQIFPRGIAPGPPKGLSMSTPTWAYQPKPSLYGLSLKKSLIKNHETLFKLG